LRWLFLKDKGAGATRNEKLRKEKTAEKKRKEERKKKRKEYLVINVLSKRVH